MESMDCSEDFSREMVAYMAAYNRNKLRVDHVAPKLEVVKNMIGKGTFGRVFIARSVLDGTNKLPKGKYYAVKSMDICMEDANKDSGSFVECGLWRIISKHPHPCVIALQDDFVEYVNGNPVMNFAMEYFPQTLYDVCRFYTNEGLDVPELKARLYSYQLFHALAHLHGIGFIHRDVKVENVLVFPKEAYTYCKYNHIIYDHFDYLAPEMIFYNLPVECFANDVWAAGCAMSILLPGHFQFRAQSGTQESHIERMIGIVGGPLETSQREFVTCHETRLTAKEICGHSSFRVLHTPENVELFHRVVESLPLLEEIKPPLWSKQGDETNLVSDDEQTSVSLEVVVVGWQGF